MNRKPMPTSAKYIVASVISGCVMIFGITIARAVSPWKYTVLIVLASIAIGLLGVIFGAIANMISLDE